MPYPRSLANSAGVVRHGEIGGEIVRPGIMLYGASPLRLRLGGVHWRAAGDDAALRDHRGAVARAGRDASATAASYTATRACRIGVVACGYADGYPRLAPYGTPVLVHGRKARIAGRVSMDMITVDITELPEAGVGSPVVAVGRGPAGRRSRARRVHRRLRAALRRRAARAVRRQQHRARRLRDLEQEPTCISSSPAPPDSSAPISSRRSIVAARPSIIAVDNLTRADKFAQPRRLRDRRIRRQGRVPRAPRRRRFRRRHRAPCCTRARAPTRWRPTAAT